MRVFLFIALLTSISACEEVQVQMISKFTSASEPNLTTGQDGKVYLTFIEHNYDTAWLKISSLEKQTWREPETITGGTNWFLNWADFPDVAVNDVGDILVNYLAKSADDKYAYDVIIKSKTNGKWQRAMRPHNDHTPTEHGFVSITPVYSGLFFLTWLDGRNTKRPDSLGNAMTLRGSYVNSFGDILSQYELDDRVCDCCQTSSAMTGDGPIVAYRDRSLDEIRDISVSKWKKSRWQESKIPHADNWRIEGCPVNGPKIISKGSSVLLTWFTAAKSSPQVKAIFSKDNGETFGEAIRIDNGNPIGRVDAVLLANGSAIVSWMEEIDDGAEFRARKIDPDGKIYDPVTIVSMSAERSSGFPQISLSGNRLIVAWTKVESEGQHEVNTGWMSVNLF